MTRTQTTTLGTPLVAFRDVALCDRREHEVAIATDGQRAYVYPIDPRTPVFEDTVVHRDGVTLTADCPCPGQGEDQCDGRLTWTLDTAGSWGADADSLRLLVSYGIGVEQ